MAHKVIDRCRETTSTTGTGTLTLTGAVSGFVAMADATIGLTSNGDTSWFCAENGSEWEVFLGTRSDATHLARTTVLSSSNSGSAVSFTAAPTVFSTVPGANISSKGPAFCAYRSTDQTGLSNNAYSKVQFNAEEFDTDGCFDSTTNHRFTPNVAGYYSVDFTVTLAGTTLSAAGAQIRKNGTALAAGSWGATNLYVGVCCGGTTVYMNGTTDYLEVFAYTTAASGNKAALGSDATRFSAFLARPA